MNDSEVMARAARVRLALFDVDGVLTDGRLFFGDDGQEYKAFHSRDGHGMKMLQKSGVTIGIITGRTSRVVEHRMRNLGIEHVFQGQKDKVPALETLLERLAVAPGECAYMGDDVVDLPVMRRVGFAATVADGPPFVREHAHWVSRHAGGQGAARELCELIMEARGVLRSTLESYL